jgi:hypothetical protein
MGDQIMQLRGVPVALLLNGCQRLRRRGPHSLLRPFDRVACTRTTAATTHDIAPKLALAKTAPRSP